MKILILGNQARATSNFWSVLIRRIKERGHEVVCIVPYPLPVEDPGWEASLIFAGARLVNYPLDRKGLNPIHDIKTLRALCRIFAEERPDVLFAFTIKPVIYGSFAAALAEFPRKEHRHVMITGLGYSFEGDTAIKRLLMQVACFLYHQAFRCVHSVFFQNVDDRKLFEKLSITTPETRVLMSKGTGVDLVHFAEQPQPSSDTTTFLYVGRMLEAKGLYELAEAARMVKAECPKARIRLLGPAEQGPGSVPMSKIEAWQREGIIEYLSATKDVRPYLAEADVVILPSWREGTPCSLLEAMSVGRPLIAADAPGSREVVNDGVNGFLVPVRDPAALANAMKRLIMDPSLRAKMGAEGRVLAETVFSAEHVAAVIMNEMGIS